MISYLGSLVQFNPAAGRAGRCRQMSLCVGSTRRVLARQPAVLAASPRVRRAFSPRGGQPRRPEVRASPRVLCTFSLRGERLGRPGFCTRSPQVRCAFSLRGEQLGQPGACAHSPPGAVRLFPPRRVARAARGLALSPQAHRAPSLRGPSARRRSGLRKSLDRNRGLFAGWEGVASLGLSLPLSPPPASYVLRGWGGSSLEFLSPFVVRTAGGVFQPVNSFLALPQFKKISLRLLSGPSGRSLP